MHLFIYLIGIYKVLFGCSFIVDIEFEPFTEFNERFSILLNLFVKSDKATKELLLRVMEKFISFLNIDIAFECVQRLIEICITCLSLNGKPI